MHSHAFRSHTSYRSPQNLFIDCKKAFDTVSNASVAKADSYITISSADDEIASDVKMGLSRLCCQSCHSSWEDQVMLPRCPDGISYMFSRLRCCSYAKALQLHNSDNVRGNTPLLHMLGGTASEHVCMQFHWKTYKV